MKSDAKWLAILLVVLLSTSVSFAQVAHYPLDTDGSDAAGGHHATSLDGATIVGTSKIGSGALSLGGTNRIPLTIDDGSTDFGDFANGYSISAWVNPDSVAATQRVFGSDRDFSSSRNFSFGIASGGGLLHTTWGVKDYNQAASIPSGAFTHIGVVLDSANDATFYVDGVAVGTVTHGAPGNTTTPTNPFFISGGAGTDPGSPSGLFSGLLDDIGFFDAELTASDFALISGLGQVGGISLQELDAAQALAAAPPGTEGLIGGFLFANVPGLPGSIGDFSGNVQNNDAVVFFADGIALVQLAVPEPASIAIWVLFAVALCGAGYVRTFRLKRAS